MRYVIFFLFFVFCISACDNQQKLTSYLRPVKEIQLDMMESFSNEISILFIVDASGSMGIANKTLSDNLRLVLEPLFSNYSNYNYNFAFTSMSPYKDFPKTYQPLQTPLDFDSCQIDDFSFIRSVNLGSYFDYSSRDIKASKDNIICLVSKSIMTVKGKHSEPYFDSLSYIIENADEGFKKSFLERISFWFCFLSLITRGKMTRIIKTK